MTDVLQKPELIIRQYHDLTPYEDRFLEMKTFTETRDEHSPDQLWILQHQDVLDSRSGRQTGTYFNTKQYSGDSDRSWWSGDLHGPGQLVAYFMFDLNRLGWNVRTLVSYAENLMIELLKKYGIDAYAKPDAPGVYVR